MTVDLLIKNGTVVSFAGVSRTDIAISGEQVIALGHEGAFPQAAKVIDAKGKIVIPGGVDPHTHFDLTDPRIAESWSVDSVAAAIGGTTTVIDHALQKKGESLMDAVRKQLRTAQERSAVDYATRPVITDFTDLEKLLDSMREVVDYGIPHFIGTTWCAPTGGFQNDWQLYCVLRRVKELDALMTLGAINGAIGQGRRTECVKQGKTDPVYHAVSGASFLEEMDITKCMMLAEALGARVYIQQATTPNSPDIIDQYRQKGLPVFCEGNPPHLLLTDDLYEPKLPRAAVYVMTPPLRKKADIEGLWKAVLAGKVQVIGSDHCGFSKAQNDERSASFVDIPNGCAGCEARVPLMFHEGVLKRGLSLHRFVELIATNPAKIHGLYPKKGVIAPGSDADIVVFDPDKKHSLNAKDLHEGTDVSAYEGMEVTGWPTVTILRGKVIVENEKFLGTCGQGQFVKGKIASDIVASV